MTSSYDGEQGWQSGESTRLPPMWLGFDSPYRRHMWVEFVVGFLLPSTGFSPGTLVFYSGFLLWFSPLIKNQHCQIPIRSGLHGHMFNELTSSRAWAGTRVVFWAGSCSFRERAQEKARIKRNYIDEQRKKSKHENEQAE